jgi:hypothetical protein
VLLGNGDGTFAAPTKYTVTTAAGTSASVAAADFNADGKLDLVTNLTSGFAVFFGNGNGTFGAQNNRTGGSSHHSLVVGDFNGDGKVDVATASTTAASVFVTWGNGNGTFNATTLTVSVGTSTARPKSLTAADFNADGRVDLAAAVSVDNAVKVLLGQTNSTFTTASYTIAGAGEMKFVGAAYLDGNATRELLVIRGQSVVLMTGAANGTFTVGTSFNLGVDTSYVVAGHMDRDPLWRLDLIASSDAGQLVQRNGI